MLGPMVYGAAYWPIAEDDDIKRMGFDDSKVLSEARREGLFEKMRTCGRIGYVTIAIPARDISYKMLRRVPYSLNAISHDAAIDLVRIVLARGVNVTSVFVDTVGDAGQYQRKLDAAFGHRISFTVSKKADSLYKTVSAASIAAKVTRDRVLRGWHFDEPVLEQQAAAAAATGAQPPVPDVVVATSTSDIDEVDDVEDADGATDGPSDAKRPRRAVDAHANGLIAVEATLLPSLDAPLARIPHPRTAGSGYPGDELTKKWLRAHIDPLFGWPSMMRFSWSTAKELLQSAAAVPVEWEEDEEDKNAAADAAQQPKVTSFFAASSATAGAGKAGGTPGAGRHLFFRQRRLELVNDATL